MVPSHEGVIEMTDELLPVEGISRRDLLKRSAIVGGASAMVWAAPSITTLGSRAFGASGSPPGRGWSHVAFLVTCGLIDYKVKWNREGGYEADPDLAPQCDDTQFKAHWDAATGVGGATNEGGTLFTVNPPGGDGENLLVFSITNVEGDCTIRNGPTSGIAFQAGDCMDAGEVIPGGLEIRFQLDEIF